MRLLAVKIYIFHMLNFLSAVTDFDSLAVQNFREYLKIPSVQPDVDYSDCIRFLRNQAIDLALPMDVVQSIAIIKWEGQDPSLPSIMFNSHMDVVSVEEEYWTHPPFGADMDKSGNIFGRGAQDVKSIGIQHLEAVRRLKSIGYKPKRTIYITYFPEEEAFSITLGMKNFVQTDYLKNMNIGFVLDEGLPSTLPEFFLGTYTERITWNVVFTCKGQAGHGSLFLNNTAAEKMLVVLEKFQDFRESEQKKLDDPEKTLGDVTTINLTILKGGKARNVVPNELQATFDMRVDIGKNLDELEKMFQAWCTEAGEGVSYEIQVKSPRVDETDISDRNVYWKAFKNALASMNLQVKPAVMPAATDGRFLRQIGIPVIGFSPIKNIPIRVHGNDEFLDQMNFLAGIKIYERVMQTLGDLEAN